MTLLYLNPDQMTQGDPELGKKLVAAFLRHPATSDTPIDVIGCVNSGINLTTKGSEVLAGLQELEKKDARMVTCGACLDYHDKRDELLIGEVGSMDQTVVVMANADKVIRSN